MQCLNGNLFVHSEHKDPGITPSLVFPPGSIFAQFYIPTMHILKVLLTKVNDMQNSVHDISKKQDSLNDKNADLNTDFQVFKAGIAKDVEFIKYKIGISSK